ncbi:MAG: hypothetical protein SVY53_15405 [Chloroflexota bacterium]|nr:hypothetical protein [Chloroflexota bacterium]
MITCKDVSNDIHYVKTAVLEATVQYLLTDTGDRETTEIIRRYIDCHHNEERAEAAETLIDDPLLRWGASLSCGEERQQPEEGFWCEGV